MTLAMFNLGASPSLVRDIAGATGAQLQELERRNFPDGEAYVRIAGPVAGKNVLLFAGPAGVEDVLPLLFAADAARAQGARRVGLVAPYLSYMRQDRAFRDGEAITSRTFARLLSSTFDWLLTVDPHLHRYASLDEIYSIPSAAVSAAAPIARWIEGNVQAPFIVGPDSESGQWVNRIADLLGAPRTVLGKTRRGDYEVELSSAGMELAGHVPVIVDDVVSSAGTMSEAVKLVRRSSTAKPICIAVHAIFGGDALHVLEATGPQAICTADTVHHVTNRISVAGELSSAIAAWNEA